jgi:REP element-mobilizing transposase RayT
LINPSKRRWLFPVPLSAGSNRRLQTFFNDEDYQAYLELVSEWCARYKVQIWAYCLMANHVHLIAVPETKEGLNLAIGEAHRRYTRRQACEQREVMVWLQGILDVTIDNDYEY